MTAPKLWWGVCVGLWVGCVDRTYMPCSGSNEDAEARVDTSGGAPVFDWEYGTAYAVSVYQVDEEDPWAHEMWFVQCGGDNGSDDLRYEGAVCIETPLEYGEDIRSPYLDTVNLTRPKPLAPGVAYRVELHTMIEDDGPRRVPENDLLAEIQSWTPDRDDPRCGSGFSAEVEFVAP